MITSSSGLSPQKEASFVWARVDNAKDVAFPAMVPYPRGGFPSVNRVDFLKGLIAPLIKIKNPAQSQRTLEYKNHFRYKYPPKGMHSVGGL